MSTGTPGAEELGESTEEFADTGPPYTTYNTAVSVWVGQVVLLRIAPSTFRPLLVTTVLSADRVEGEVFLNWRQDLKAEWVRQHCFYPPDQEHRSIEVRDCSRGGAVGEWEAIKVEQQQSTRSLR